MWSRLRRCLVRWRQPALPSLIIVGIGVPAWEAHRDAAGTWRTVAFIDENPWNHRTLVDGVPVFYPSEVASLCRNRGVRRILFTEREPFERLAPALAEELAGTGVEIRFADA